MLEHATPETAPLRDSSETLRGQFDRGVRNFSLLFTRWMDTNGWSHPVIVSLATSCLELPGNKGWLHSSQISGLRHGGLKSPGPRAFMAIERLNFYLHRYATEKLLIPGTSSSNFYADPYVITENGSPPPLGWWLEVFCGARLPKDIDLTAHFFSQAQAEVISSNWGKLVRRLLIAEGRDIVEELDRIVRAHYPVREPERVERLAAVLQNRGSWDPEQLQMELPALATFTAELGGPADEAALLKAISS